MKNNSINIIELEKLIDKYFNAQTSESEERFLRRILASCEFDTDKINEARATLGFLAMSRANKGQSNLLLRYGKIAAMISIVILISSLFFYNNNSQQDICVAYTEGQEINNSEVVMDIVANDLKEIHIASCKADENIQAEMENMLNEMESKTINNNIK